jgi:pyridoxamine 5'-phosphate oxidase
MQTDIAGIRKSYSQKTLSEDDIEVNPFGQFERWWKEAMLSNIEEVNAMTLATASADGVPSARIVLLKGYSEEGFIFYTNYDSYKGRQLSENPKACLVFFWKELERQIRITGIVQKTSKAASDAYFQSRPYESRIGAAASPQSSPVESRDWLEKRYGQLKDELNGKEIERPGNWGGYIVKPVIFEFWQGRLSRLHDRIEYSLQNNGQWNTQRLAP